MQMYRLTIITTNYKLLLVHVSSFITKLLVEVS